jgi:uncharacterized membrane protein
VDKLKHNLTAMTIDHLIFVFTLIAALGCGLVAGVFFAFSTFVMKGLSRLPVAEGIVAMQSINLVVLRSWFMVAFLGTAIVSLLAVFAAILRWHEPEAMYLLMGGLLYLVGSFVVTIAFNVPRNEALAKTTASDPVGASLWSAYVGQWTAWNHVRTAASLAAAAAFSVALGV